MCLYLCVCVCVCAVCVYVQCMCCVCVCMYMVAMFPCVPVPCLEDMPPSFTLFPAGKEHEPSVALLLSNRAACLLKNGDSQRCIEDCTRSLALSPLSVKTILRRATAYDSLEK